MRRLLCFLWLITLPFTVARAQDKPAKPPNQTEEEISIRVNTDFVSFEVAVADRNGAKTVPRLRAEDFAIYEDGVRQKISNFSAADVPFNVALLIDTSGSARDEISLIRKAALGFLTQLQPTDRVAVLQFHQEVELIKDLTADRSELERALNSLQGGSGTSFYDALQLTLNEVFRNVEGRKAIIALTDGVDSFGKLTYEKILPQLERANAKLYFLKLNTESFTTERMALDCKDPAHFRFSRKQLKKYFDEFVKEGILARYQDHCLLGQMERRQINRRLYEAADKELRELANVTGGQIYPVQSLTELEPAYTQIATELRTQYSLAYYPTNEKHDGRWRTLKVTVSKPNLKARARPGYRAPRD